MLNRINFITLCIALLSPIAFPADIFVPDDYTKIQYAINAAVDGDTVIVRPGTYSENVDFKSKAITLRSEYGPSVTTIDGSQAGSVVTFNSGEDASSVLMGFTITNGSGTVGGYSWHYGGGIYCSSSSPTISNNTISGNSAPDVFGGGLYCEQSSATVTGNIIVGNSYWDMWGGGIYCYDSDPSITNNTIIQNDVFCCGGVFCDNSAPIIEYNFISQNNAGGMGLGGAIHCLCSSPTITNNSIIQNWAMYMGGGIFCQDSTTTIRNNLIKGNSVDFDGGGGIYCDEGTTVICNNIISENQVRYDWGGGIRCSGSTTICGNILSGNSAHDGGGIRCSNSTIISNNTVIGNSAVWEGGGIWCCHGSPTVSNTVLWDNSASLGKEIWIGESSYPSTLTISYSDVEGGLSSVYVDPGCTLNWGPGMIDADPLFSGTATDDFHLTWNSPCRDSGDNSVVTELYDFEGDPRIHDGTVDMGADEFYLHLYSIGEVIPGSPIVVKVVGIPGTTTLTLGLGSGIQDPPQATPYGDLWLLPPIRPRLPMPDIGPDGLSILSGTIPNNWLPGEQYPFQVLAGSELTNLMVLTVE